MPSRIGRSAPSVDLPQSDEPESPTAAQSFPDNPIEPYAGSPVPEQQESPAAAKRSGLSSAAENALELVRMRSQRSLSDLLFGKRSDHDAVAALQYLSPRDFRAVVEQLGNERLLDMHIGRDADPVQRRAFLELAERAGMISAEPGAAGEGPFDPPGAPSLFIQSGALSEAIHEDFLHQQRTYAKAYGEYEQRYAEAARGAASVAELRKLGPPAPAARLFEPGLVRDSAEHAQWLSESRQASPTARPYEALQDRFCELTGQPRAGAYYVKFKAEAALLHGRVGGEVKLAQHHEGAQFATEKALRTPTEPGVTIGFAHGEAESVRFDAPSHGPAFVKLSRNGALELGAPSVGPLGAVAAVDPEHATFEQGLGFKKGIHGLAEIELSATFGAYGLTAEQARHALESPGLFYAPEREAGLSWSELSPERREGYAKMQWTAAEWDAR
jgi:hypothetical protein